MSDRSPHSGLGSSPSAVERRGVSSRQRKTALIALNCSCELANAFPVFNANTEDKRP